MLVGLIVDTVTGDPPNETVEPLWNPVPAIVTEVPPALGPLFGEAEATVGAATNVKQPLQLPTCASGFVTTTLTAPGACAVVVPVIEVGLVVETLSAEPPKETVAPAWKPDPLTVTDVPPALGPLDGATDVTVGPATYVKQPPHVPVCVSGFVTTTFTLPAACAVVVPAMVVGVIVETVNADPPNETVAPDWKSVPVIVTAVPPSAGPLVGVIPVTVGAATYLKHPLQVAVCVSGFVTVTLTAPAV